MKKNTILIILILILLIPETKKSVDSFFLYGSEGMVAIQLFSTEDEKPTPLPEPDKPKPSNYKCNTCKDTGVVKPDGVVEIPCPECRVPKNTKCDCTRGCGLDGCLCKTQTSKCKEEVAQKVRRIVLLTQPDICAPCRTYDLYTVPKLRAAGITVGNKETDNIQMVDPTRPVEHQLWKQYGHLGNGGIPLFLAFEDDKFVKHEVGAISEQQTLKLLGK